MFDSAPLAATTAQVRATVAAWAAAQAGRPVLDPATEVVTIAELIDQLTGVKLARLAEVDRSGLATDRGLPASTAAWLTANTGMSPGTAARQVHTARILDQVLPETAALLCAGGISADQAQLISQAAGASPTTRAVAAADETALLDIVRPLTGRPLREALQYWRHAVDPVGGEGDEQTAYERRTLDVSVTFEKMVAINGILDPVGGAAVLAAIDTLAAAAAADDLRRPAVRRADALTQLARLALASRDLPDNGGERPHITITTDLRTLTGQSTQPAQLDRIGPISARLARQILCDAGITRIITDGPSEILDVGRRTRTIPPALRRALNIRDRGWVFEGCDRPISWTEAHHVVHWADGGPTRLDNVGLLCPAHHRAIHQHGWTLTWGPDRRWHSQPPPDQPHANPWTSGRRGRTRRKA